MPKNSPVWPEKRLLILAALLALGSLLFEQQAAGQDSGLPDAGQRAAGQQEAGEERQRPFVVLPPDSRWYRSNASGMPLEIIPSRIGALGNDYALAISAVSQNEIPPLLLAYYISTYSVELRTLFEKGQILRQQWIFRDSRGTARVNASGTPGLFSETGPLPENETEPLPEDENENEDEAEVEENETKGFIEFYNSEHTLTEEILFSGGSESRTLFTYTRGFLVKAETWIKEPPAAAPSPGPVEDSPGESEAEAPEVPTDESPEAALLGPDITDYYRYSRSASLRAIERIFHSGSPRRRVPFPSLNPLVSREPRFENPGVAHSSGFLDDVVVPPEGRVIYNTDSRGRVLSEERLDQDGEVLGELENNWAGERLSSVSWKSGDDEWLIEYEYDAEGNRTMERNFNRGVLERTVQTEGTREVEELYMNGKIVLRAIWEEGRKISEERVR